MDNNLSLAMLGAMNIGFNDKEDPNVYAKIVFVYSYKYDVENICHYGNGVANLTEQQANNSLKDIRQSILNRLGKDLSPHAFANLVDFNLSIYYNPNFKKGDAVREDYEHWKNTVCCDNRIGND